MLALKHWQTDQRGVAWGPGEGMPPVLGHAGGPGALPTRGMPAVGSRAQKSGCLRDSASVLTEIFIISTPATFPSEQTRLVLATS